MTATIDTKRLPHSFRDLTRLEFFLLCAFLFFLPLAEAPKNLLLYTLFGAWVYGCIKRKSWGANTPFFEWPLMIIVIMSFVPVFFRQGDQIRALNNCVDFLSIALLMVLVARSRLSPIRSSWLFAWILIGVCVTVLYGVWRGGQFPSLHSVGHMNQVAIYLGIITVAALGSMFLAGNRREMVFYTGSVGLLCFLLIATGSRNALFATALTAALIPVLGFIAHMKVRAALAALGLTVVVTVSLFYQPPALVRQLRETASTQALVDDARQRLWRSSFFVAQSVPLFGHGVGFFGEGHSPARIQFLIERAGGTFEERNFFWTNHAHNLVLNWLVERGWIATIILLIWISYAAYSLSAAMYRRRGVVKASAFSDFVGVLTLLSTLFFGIGNTSWHHEHGMLAAVLIGIAWGLKTEGSGTSPRLGPG